MIPYGRQEITEADIDAVVAVLRSDYLTQGPAGPGLRGGGRGGDGGGARGAVNWPPAGLHIACLALGLGKGDLLWTSPITFVASANVGHLCGADADFRTPRHDWSSLG